MPECKCGNCRYYNNETDECNITEEPVLPSMYCMQHRIDWEKEREADANR